MYMIWISVYWLSMNVHDGRGLFSLYFCVCRKIKDEPDDSEYYKSSSSKHKKSKRSKRDKEDESDKPADDAS